MASAGRAASRSAPLLPAPEREVRPGPRRGPIPARPAGFPRAARPLPPRHPLRALHELGELERALGQLDDAERRFLEAVEIEPGDHIAWNFLGSIHAARGERERALDDFTRAVAARPGYALGHANRGTLLLAFGRDQEALAAFDAALAADPGLAAVRAAAEGLRAGAAASP